MEDKRAARLTANDKFKRTSGDWTMIGMLLAVGLHLALFVFVRPFEAEDLGVVAEELTALNLPPEVKIPPPPEQIARPATPRVADFDMSPDITIEKTDFSAFTSAEDLPPPAPSEDPSDRPTFIPRDTDPVLQDQSSIVALLERSYPENLKNAGIGGTVVFWLFVDENGTVANYEIKTSSGNTLLDQAAVPVVTQMRFSPAMSRDKPVGVWVDQPVTFEVT